MFNRKLTSDSFSNLIAEGSTIDGKVQFTGIIKIQGTVNGDIICNVPQGDKAKLDDCIIVDKSGVVTSDSMTSSNMIISGKVTSKKIWAENTLRILKTANIRGALIYYRTLEMEPGAMLHECQLKHLDHSSEGEVV